MAVLLILENPSIFEATVLWPWHYHKTGSDADGATCTNNASRARNFNVAIIMYTRTFFFEICSYLNSEISSMKNYEHY